MSKDELLTVMLDAMSDSDMEINDRVVEENRRLVDQVFLLAGIQKHDDKIHASQYDEHISAAREILDLKESGMLN